MSAPASKARVWTLRTLYDRCLPDGGCMLWQQAVNSAGYPQARIGGHRANVRAWTLEQKLGRPMRKGKVVSARCGQRLCCATGCLFEATRGAILAEQYRSGSRSLLAEGVAKVRLAQETGRAKLSAADVRDVLAAPLELSHSELARRYGVSKTHIRCIRLGLRRVPMQPAANSSVFAWRGAA